MADKETRNYVRSRMRKYNEYRKEIKVIEESIRYPWKESDENIGGGRGSLTSNPTEQQAIIKIDSKELKSRTQLLNIIDYVVDSSDPITQKIINMRYKNHFSWEKIAQTINYSEPNCRRIDCRVVDRVAFMLAINY